MTLGTVEPEPEVRVGHSSVSRTAGNSMERLRELRFHLESEAWRITYWIASDRRIVLLTAFRKTRMREIERARRVFRRCMAERHSVDEDQRSGQDG